MDDQRTNANQTEPVSPPPERQRERRRRSEGREIAGLILIAIGAIILIERMTGLRVSLVPLGIGIAFLFVWARGRNYGFLIPGAILAGLGLGIAAADLPGVRSGASVTGGLALGFFGIYLLDGLRTRSIWGAITGVILGLVSLATSGFRLDFVIPAEVAPYVLPVSLILLGLLVIFRSALPDAVTRPVIAVVIIVAILAFVSRGFAFGLGAEQTEEFLLPSLEGRTVVVDLGSSDLSVSTGSGRPTFTAKIRAFSRPDPADLAALISITETRDEVRIETRRPRAPIFGWRSTDLELSLPAEASVSVRAGSGDVELGGSYRSVDVETGSGDVELLGSYRSVDVETGSGDVFAEVRDVPGAGPSFGVRTGSGDVELVVFARDPRIDISTDSGEIEAEDFVPDPRPERSILIEGSRGEVKISTGSGDVSLLRRGQ